jgi:hypothetical protein
MPTATAEKKIKVPDNIQKAIEERLTLPGGTTSPEVGADLANRFGFARQEYNKALAELEAKLLPPKERRAKRNSIESKYKDARMKEIGKYGNLFIDYLLSYYGSPIKNEMGLVIMYGDNIEVSAKKHYHRIL